MQKKFSIINFENRNILLPKKKAKVVIDDGCFYEVVPSSRCDGIH